MLKKVLVVAVAMFFIYAFFFYKAEELPGERKSTVVSSDQWASGIDGAVHHLVLGDSVAQGVGSEKGGYAAIASEELEQLMQKEVVVDNAAVGGSTSGELLRLVEQSDMKRKIRGADLITINTGGNNLLRLNLQGDVTAKLQQLNKEKKTYQNDLQRIFEIIRAENPGAIIVISELYNPLQLGAAEMVAANIFLDNWNAGIYDLAKRNEPAVVIPVQDILSVQERDLFRDAIHPNDKGYTLMASAFVEEMKPYIP